MKPFIKAIDENAWRAILIVWEHPITKDTKGKVIPILEETRSTNDDKLGNNNLRPLNAIFNGVDANQFKFISTCESAKKEWIILQIANEGTTIVKLLKLHMQLGLKIWECLKVKQLSISMLNYVT